MWKTLVLVVVVVASFVFARDYFELVTLMAAVLWATEHFRTRGERAGKTQKASVAAIADLLGRRRHPFQRSMKLRVRGVAMNVTAFVVTRGSSEVQITDIATPLFRRTPFCFVVRLKRSLIPEAQLVENSKIPGVRFEYALKRMEFDQPFEAASNMPDLMGEVLGKLPPADRLEALLADGLKLQKYFFNGRVLHSYLVAGDELGRVELTEYLGAHVEVHRALRQTVDNVNFKVPS